MIVIGFGYGEYDFKFNVLGVEFVNKGGWGGGFWIFVR